MRLLRAAARSLPVLGLPVLGLPVLGLLVVGLLVLTPLSVAHAQRPTAPRLLPEGTLAYARVASVPELVKAFQKTSAGKMFQDEKIRPLIQDLYNSAADAFKAIENEVGLSLNDLLAIPQGEACFAVVGADQGSPALVLMVQVDDKLSSAEQVVNKIIGRIEGRGGKVDTIDHQETLVTVLNRRNNRQAVIFDRDGLLVLTSDLDLGKQILDVWAGKAKDAKTFANNTQFTAIMQKCIGTKDERPQITWYVNPIELVRQVTRGNFTAQAGLALLDPLGLDGLKALGGSVIMAAEEFDAINHMHVLMDSPREGVLEMLALTDGDTTPEDWAPKTASNYMTVHWNFSKTYRVLADIIGKVRFDDEALDKEVARRIDKRFDIDFKEDVLAALDGRVTLVNWVEQPVRLNSQSTLVGIKLKDGKKFAKLFKRLIEANLTGAKAEKYGGIDYYTFPRGRRQQNLDSDLLRIPQPCGGIVGDYLVFSDSTKLLHEIIRTRKNPSQSLAKSEDFQSVADMVKRHSNGKQVSMLIFARPDEGLRSIYEMAQSETTKKRLAENANNPFFGALHRALQKNELPPFETLRPYFRPTGSMVTSDETGIHYMEFGLKESKD